MIMKKLLNLIFLLFFSLPLIAQEEHMDYLVFTKETTGYPRRILMPINQVVRIKLKSNPGFSWVYLSRITEDNLVLDDGRIISFENIIQISGKTVITNNSRTFGKIMLGVGVATTVVAAGVIIIEVSANDVGFGTVFAAPALLLTGTLIFLGDKIKKGRRTFNTTKWNISTTTL